ncbi:MAG: dTMP kinase [Candidatus Bathyarchaeota archaeon]|nr:dTMP kinase [Candidatus Bathyarchaeota archaeon]
MVKKGRGVFICLEGIDGSGKTTVAHHLVGALARNGYSAVYTAEPSKGAIGIIVKKSILQGGRRLPRVLEAVLFAVDRVDHIEREVTPLLNEGKIVVCDRYLYSSISYQGADGAMLKWVKGINKHAIKPDLAIYIDVPPEVVIERIKRKKSIMETLPIQRRVREVYLNLVAEKQLMMVDGNASEHKVAKDVEDLVFSFLRKH